MFNIPSPFAKHHMKSKLTSDPIFSFKARECLAEDDPHGLRYTGNLNTTVCGYSCQRWDVQVPHSHKFTPLLGSEENFCRNPGDLLNLWCFTTDVNKRWEKCAALQACGKIKSEQNVL